MGMVHTAHHTLAQQTFRLAGIIEKSLPYPLNCLQKLKFKLAKTNYTHYTSSYTETQQTRAFSDHFALWKCGKRPLRRWKTDIHGPMEKPPAFPQPANIVSHSSASMTVYAHSHSAYYGEYPSCPILMERDKREQKRSGSVTLGSNRRRRSRSVMEKCSKLRLYTPQIRGRGPHEKP